MTQDFDVIIVGAGPAGQSAALIMARANIRVCVVDARVGVNNHGYNFITRDGATKHELIDYGSADLARYPHVALHRAKVETVAKQGDKFVVGYEDGRSFSSEYLVLANGIQFRSPILDLPGGREIFGTSMFTCPYCHAYEFTDKRFAIISSGDVMPESFTVLGLWSDKFTCFSDGVPVNENDGMDEFLRQMHPKNEIIRAPIAGFIQENGLVKAIELKDGSRVAVDAVFLTELAAKPNVLADQLGVKKQESEGVEDFVYAVDELGRSNIRNLLLLGDSKNAFSTLIGAAYEGFSAGYFLIDIIANARSEMAQSKEAVSA